MFEIGQEVTVINEKGIAYDGVVMARATGEDGQKAYKISIDGGGLNQLGQWHKASDVFVIDPPARSLLDDFPSNSLRH